MIPNDLPSLKRGYIFVSIVDSLNFVFFFLRKRNFKRDKRDERG